MIRLLRTAASSLLLLPALALTGHAASNSALWGRAGEAWTPASRLPDFSFAGYHRGEAPIPDPPVAANVRDFGARGDGKTDDTKAIQAAIEATKTGAILLPAGRYVLTDAIIIRKSGMVLRGEGADRTVLAPLRPLAEIHPRANVDSFKSPYSFSGGFVELAGGDRGRRVAAVTEAARRGSRVLRLDKTPPFRAGDRVRITMGSHPDLGRHIHADRAGVGEDTAKRNLFFDWVAVVEQVSSNAIGLDRPLRLDVRPEWKAEVWTYAPTVRECGIEDLAFEFSGVPKKEHLLETGHNAIYIRGAADSWVRRVRIVDADNGINAPGARFCRFDEITFPRGRRANPTGHHALWATGHAQDCLFTRFDIAVQFVHDITVEGFASGNVFSQGRGASLNFDHHRNAPYENLFTQISVGQPRRVWNSSGRGDRGPHAGARESFWNVTGDSGFPSAPADWPELNLVGVPVKASEKQAKDLHLEATDPGSLIQPPDLHEAQRRRRLAQGADAGLPLQSAR